MELQNWIDKGHELLMDFGPKVLTTIVIWIIGSWIIKAIIRAVKKTAEKRNYDVSLKSFC